MRALRVPGSLTGEIATLAEKLVLLKNLAGNRTLA